jgi:hypothetical protein
MSSNKRRFVYEIAFAIVWIIFLTFIWKYLEPSHKFQLLLDWGVDLVWPLSLIYAIAVYITTSAVLVWIGLALFLIVIRQFRWRVLVRGVLIPLLVVSLSCVGGLLLGRQPLGWSWSMGLALLGAMWSVRPHDAADRRPEDEECTEPFVVLQREMRLALRIIVCAMYILWWRGKHLILSDDRLKKGAKWAVIPSAVVLFLDIVLFFFHTELAIWLGGAALGVLVITALVLMLHRFLEALSKQTGSSFTTRIGPVVDALSDAAATPHERQREALDVFVEILFKNIHECLQERIRVNVNLMFPDANGNLRIVYLYPIGTIYDPEFSLKPGEGAAGYCFQKGEIVYVPAIRYAHGILVTLPTLEDGADAKIKFGLKPRLYVQIERQFEIFASIVSLPITSPLGKHAVLNVDSSRADAFNFSDINILNAYARVLGRGIAACSR